MSRKLDRLCHIVEATGSPAPDITQWQQTPPSTTSFMTSSAAPSVVETEDSTRPDLKDEPTLVAQATFATDYAKRVFHHSIISHEMTRSLNKLREMLKDDDGRPASPTPKSFLPSHGVDMGGVHLPPMELAVSCIQKLRSMFPRLRILDARHIN